MLSSDFFRGTDGSFRGSARLFTKKVHFRPKSHQRLFPRYRWILGCFPRERWNFPRENLAVLVDSCSFHSEQAMEIPSATAISIAYSEKCHFPSLTRKKSKGESTIYDLFKRFFQRSLGKIQRFLGKNLGTGATSFHALSEKHLCWLHSTSVLKRDSVHLECRGCDPSFPVFLPGSRSPKEGHGCPDHDGFSACFPGALRLLSRCDPSSPVMLSVWH